MSAARGVFRRRCHRAGPLQRDVDRLDARWTRTLLAVLVVLGPLLTAWAAGSAWSWQADGQRAHRAALSQVAATITEVTPASSSAGPYLQLAWAEATWRAPDGSPRAGLITAGDRARPGDVAQIWVDARGQQVPAPGGLDDAAGAATAAGLACLLVLVTVAAVVHLALGAVLDRRRAALWEAEWAATEPQWTHRAH
jgi:hypothetical protein